MIAFFSKQDLQALLTNPAGSQTHPAVDSVFLLILSKRSFALLHALVTSPGRVPGPALDMIQGPVPDIIRESLW